MTPYITLKTDSYYEFTEKRSVFIGCVHPVSSEEEAVSFIGSVRKKYSDARHVAYAYSIYADEIITKRFSDDGEPQGTAGKPILDVLDKQEITNAVITVTRYFGGILLGAPGLLRAYTEAASGAVKKAEIRKFSLCRKISFTVSYNQYGRIGQILQSFPLKISPPVFTDNVFSECTCDAEAVEEIVRKITDATAGTAEIKISDPFLFDLEQ